MMENNSGTRRVYNAQMMAQQAQALDALQKVHQLEQAMEPDHPNGDIQKSMPELAVGHTEVCSNMHMFPSTTDEVREPGRIRLERQ
jgi:hypothetical protein